MVRLLAGHVSYIGAQILLDSGKEMPVRSAFSLHQHALAAAILVVALVATWFVYSPGIGAGIQFDDTPNLGELAQIIDVQSALKFIATGGSGPLGRPIALASFAPQAYAWPDTPSILLRTNVLIHLLNGALVSWFLYLLGLSRRQTERNAALVAVAAASLWMLMPILASSSLFIVQRMTTLAATFVLLGMIGYLYARRWADRNPALGLSLMTVMLLAGASLGVLSKENGILIFVFALTIEAVLLDRPTRVTRTLWRIWFSTVLLLPTLILLSYLATRLPYTEGVVLLREFNGYERLITQAEILWRYLYQAFIPNAASLGPFHDDFPVQRSLLNIQSFFFAAAWVAAIAAAIILRRKAPLFAFATAWYLLGHSLESSTIALELYYEHRNYFPLIGPVYALVATSLLFRPEWRKVFVLAVAAYSVTLGAVLYSVTSLWGSPAMAAEMWSIYKPDSLRATQHVAVKYELERDPWGAEKILRTYAKEHPEFIVVRLQLLQLSCLLEPEADHSDTILYLEQELKKSSFSNDMHRNLAVLYDQILLNSCPALTSNDIYRMGISILENPRFNVPIVINNVHVLLARIGVERRDLNLTMSHIEQALSVYPSVNTLAFGVGILSSAGLHESSRDLFRQSESWPRPLSFRRLYWESELVRLANALNENPRDLTQDL